MLMERNRGLRMLRLRLRMRLRLRVGVNLDIVASKHIYIYITSTFISVGGPDREIERERERDAWYVAGSVESIHVSLYRYIYDGGSGRHLKTNNKNSNYIIYTQE